MKKAKIRRIAIERGVKVNTKSTKESMVRDMQSQEGSVQCFNGSTSEPCIEINCLWFSDCKTGRHMYV